MALTRAESWLIVCGAGAQSQSGESWHDLAAQAMADIGAAAEPGAEGEILTLSHNWPARAAAAVPEPAAAQLPLPDWTRRPARLPAPDPRPVSPSALGGVHVLAGDPTGLLSEEEAKARGSAVHRLLEHLHGQPAASRTALAARLLPGTADLDGILAEAATILDHPELGFLFGADSLAEVGVAAPLPELAGARISGRIDRLVVRPDRVLAVDFKSNQAVPATPEAIPDGILRQMAAYRAALAAIFPGRRVEIAVLWTRTAHLMRLPEALLAGALEGVGA